ncbi:MAG TPA: YihY/virulence factor BrkB family protein [Candidatus Dormibacteraeota bacterium]
MRLAAAGVMDTFPGQVVRRTLEDNVPSQAVLIAWAALQSIFPLALALAAILGLVLGSVGVDSTRVYETVAALVPDPGARAQVLDALHLVTTQTGLFAILALIGFLWTASSLFGAMEQTFDAILRLSSRTFVSQKLMAVLMMLIFTVLAGVAIVTSTLLPLVTSLPGVSTLRLTHPPLSFVTQFVIGALSGFLLYFAIYYVVPNRRQRPSAVWPGALIAGVGFEILTLAFPIYLSIAGRGMNQYGKTFALLFILMAFFYFVGLLTLVGLECNAVLHPASPSESSESEERAPAAEAPPAAVRGPRRALFAMLGAAIGLLMLRRPPRTRPPA